MCSRAKWFLTASFIALTAAPAFGQAQPGRMPFLEDGVGTPYLLMNKGVQKEIKLTDEQLNKARQLVAGTLQKYRPEMIKARKNRLKVIQLMRDASRESRDKVEKALPELLSSEQLKRFKQIDLQANGVHALARSNVQSELQLSDKQKTDIKRINADLRQGVVALFKEASSTQLRKIPEAAQKARALNDEATKKALGVLTPEQQKNWNEMIGEKFELKFDAPVRRGARP